MGQNVYVYAKGKVVPARVVAPAHLDPKETDSMANLIARTFVTETWTKPAALPVHTPSLAIHELPLAGIIRIQGSANDSQVIAAIQTATGLTVPLTERYVEADRDILARVGPNEWLLFTDLAVEERALQALQRNFGDVFANATLVSDSRIALAVAGDAAPDFLAKGCALDFHPTAFPPGTLASTRFAGLPAAILHRTLNHYVIYFDVALAEFVVSWLVDASKEFER
ncbi:hypothetical protein ACEQUB_00346 [Ralstonia syzygii]